MLYRQMLDLYDILDDGKADGERVIEYLKGINPDCLAETHILEGEQGVTHMVRVVIPGQNGKRNGGEAPTIGILGRLGGLGARPERVGFVSDGDGALAALTAAAKLLDMQRKGDCLQGDVIVSTHVCPDAPTKPHEPVPFMGSPVEMYQVNQDEVTEEMDAILSIDTTKGNRIANERGFFISPTVKEGYILRVSERLLDLMEITTGRRPRVFALTQQDITPYGNDLFHINSILQPSVATSAPVVGVAVTTETIVPGCATGATQLTDIEEATRFVIEVAKEFGQGVCDFYDKEEYARIQKLYGSMTRFQGFGEKTEKKYQIGVIRVVTQEKAECERHGRLLESWFPEFSVISRCIPDQPEGVHDEASEAAAIPKIQKLAKEFEELGADGVILSCCGDPGLDLIRRELSIPLVGAGESTALMALHYGERVYSLGIIEDAPENYKKVLKERLIGNAIPDGVHCTLDLQGEKGWNAVCKKAKTLKENGADVIALACTGMASIGIAPKLEEVTGIPVLDPVMCEGLVMYMELLRRNI